MPTPPFPNMNIGKLVWMLVAVLGALFLAGISYLLGEAKQDSVQTFAECQSYPGSTTLETFPEQCILPNGKTFSK